MSIYRGGKNYKWTFSSQNQALPKLDFGPFFTAPLAIAVNLTTLGTMLRRNLLGLGKILDLFMFHLSALPTPLSITLRWLLCIPELRKFLLLILVPLRHTANRGGFYHAEHCVGHFFFPRTWPNCEICQLLHRATFFNALIFTVMGHCDAVTAFSPYLTTNSSVLVQIRRKSPIFA